MEENCHDVSVTKRDRHDVGGQAEVFEDMCGDPRLSGEREIELVVGRCASGCDRRHDGCESETIKDWRDDVGWVMKAITASSPRRVPEPLLVDANADRQRSVVE